MNLFSNEKILYKKQTPYNDITVTQRGDLVTLWSPENIKQSEINLAQPLHPRLEYNCSVMMGLAFCPWPSSMLGLGLGGGVIPSIYSALCPESQIEVVEIDPEMIPVAEQFFSFPTSERVRIIVQDAFFYVVQQLPADKKYDIIFMDTYLGNTMPDSIKSFKFFKKCGAHLNTHGVFIANLMSGDIVELKKMLRRLGRVFKSLWYLPGEFTGNIVVFGCKTPITEKVILENALHLGKRFWFPFQAIQLAVRIKKKLSSFL